MPEPSRPSFSPVRNFWVGPSLGILLGICLGLATGLHTLGAHRFLAYGLKSLAWSTLLAAIHHHVIYGLVLMAAIHLLIVFYGSICKTTNRWLGLLGCLMVGLGLAGGLMLPLNQTAWFPALRSPAGMALNLLIVVVFFAWAILQGMRGGLTPVAAWIGAPRTGRAIGLLGCVGLLALAGLNVVGYLNSATPATDAPHVVLISIDTLRYDHMSINGYERETSPGMDALAREAVSFDQATTPRPKTTPSVVSMLTGLYPHNSGVRRLVDRLHPNRTTLQEVFRNAGYRTGAVICNAVLCSDNSGLDTGFDYYDDDTPEYSGTQLDSAPATDRALSWLRAQDGAPAFLWVHYMDPHGPYAAPPPYDQKFVNPDRGTRHAPLEEIPTASRLGEETDVDFYIDQYDGEILYTDLHVARLIDELDALGMRDNTVLVVTSDHGESLGQHNYFFEHGKYIYDDCAHIPLIIRYPGGAAGTRIDAQVELIDLYPTLLDLAGIDSPARTDGVSLRPLLEGGPSPRTTPAYLERYTMLKGIRTPEWKVIHTYAEDGAIIQREFYDLVADPGETQDLYAEDLPRIRELEEQLFAWTDSDPVMALRPGVEAEGEQASEEMLKKLRALGYVQ